MKQLIIIIFTFLLSNLSFGQVSGNINYQNQVRFPDNNINVNFSSNSTIISVKGLANVKADSYVAIFSTTQVGKTTQEVNELIDTRINQALEKIKVKPNVKTFIDMISFVPVYEYDIEKKIFSKKTYNEIPTGFELKKNIHIEYTDPNLLNEIISILSSVEIYDLVRVDYFSTKLESIKKELRTKSKIILQEKIKNYESILSKSLDSLNKTIVDGFKVVLPVEMYKSYQSYSSSSLNLKKSANINTASKSKTVYYQPIIDKEFDFVINPTILEPVIQVMYEIKLNIEKINERKTNKEYILITPNGDLKNINLK
ncbi:SIMPL domain-containing protein [Tenacibaculum soleae]|uniref:SIMPL domain-containing protein n=1 Tax=Tenacibaculum soleae TaxID=447689 RepID=UPI0023004145|nr:SIMPL domain-containing protein [Tenacibaculum soleae]